MSPGPDFIVVMKNAIHWKKQWYFTALWIASAILIHISYCVAWVGIIISQSIILFQIIKILWALYLLYLAYQLLKSGRNKDIKIQKEMQLTSLQSFKQGFITNVMNPKATLFFLSVFTQVISPETAVITQGFYGVIMAITAWVWFSIFTTIINFRVIQKNISSFQDYLNKFFWIFLTILWIKILTEK